MASSRWWVGLVVLGAVGLGWWALRDGGAPASAARSDAVQASEASGDGDKAMRAGAGVGARVDGAANLGAVEPSEARPGRPAGPPSESLVRAVDTRGDRMLGRFEATARKLEGPFKALPGARDDLHDVRVQLEADLADVQHRFASGEIGLDEAHQEMHAATGAAEQALTKLEGPAGAIAAKLLAPEVEWPAAENGADWGGSGEGW